MKEVTVFVIVFSLLVIYTEQSNLRDEGERIKRGVTFINDLADTFANGMGNLGKKFIKPFQDIKLDKIGVASSAAFGLVSIILDIAFSFVEQPESAEMEFMRQEFQNINNRFDHVFQQFQDVKNEIKWANVRVTFAKYELSIRAMVSEVNALQYVNEGNETIVKHNFITRYRGNYDDSAKKLALAITSKSNIFSDNLLGAVMEYTQNHRPKVQAFMAGLLELVVTGMQIEATYYKLIDEKLMNVMQKQWEKIMIEVKQEMGKVVTELENHWRTQLEKDIPVYTEKHHALGHKEFAESLRNFLEEKFISKDFFVFSYREMHGFEVHAWKCCACILQLRKSGRNLLVAWAERSSRVYTEKHKENEEVDSRQRSGYLVLKGQGAAYEVLNSFETTCNERNTLGVVGVNHEGYISSHENRLVYTQINVKLCSGILNSCRKHDWPEFFVIKTK